MNEQIETRDRIVGALMGLAIGDALGAPVEHMDRQSIALEYPSGLNGYADRPSSGFRPGQGTDDTEMAFLTAESIIEKQDLDMPDLVNRLIAWGTNYPALGPSTGAGVAALAKGTPWHKAGQTAVASSGCLPRCAPVALFSSAQTLVTDTIRCCQPTHRHPLALAATVALNLVLERLVRGLAWHEALGPLANGTESFSVEIAAIRQAISGEFSSPGAVDVLVEALHCVGTAHDAQSAVVASVMQGGDTDTRAAVAGALAGARWGILSFPERWIEGCEAGREAFSLGKSLTEIRLLANPRGA